MLNTVVYDLEFLDGSSREYSANVIAENMIFQVDDDGFQTRIMEGIIYSQMDMRVACPKSAKLVKCKRVHKRLRCTTKGWKLLVIWKEGQSTWVPFKYLKE